MVLTSHLESMIPRTSDIKFFAINWLFFDDFVPSYWIHELCNSDPIFVIIDPENFNIQI